MRVPLMVVFWVGLGGALAVWGMRALGGQGREQQPSHLDIAKERYARGEISREQYEELRQALVA